MNGVIDLGNELLVDRSRFHFDPLQLLLSAIGEPLARGSAWVAVKKSVAALYSLPLALRGGKFHKPHGASRQI